MKKNYTVLATIYDRRGRPLAFGVNSYEKTHPLQAKYAHLCGLPAKQFLHAEIAAIVRLKHPWKAHHIHVERYDKQGQPRPAKPCPICQRAIDALKIPIVTHT